MTATRYSLHRPRLRHSGSFQTPDGRLVHWAARRELNGVTMVNLSVCGNPLDEMHLGEVAARLAPSITRTLGSKVARAIVETMTAAEAR